MRLIDHNPYQMKEDKAALLRSWALPVGGGDGSAAWPPPNLMASTEYAFWEAHNLHGWQAESHAGHIQVGESWAVATLFFGYHGSRYGTGGFAVLRYYSGPKAKTHDVEYYRWGQCLHEMHGWGARTVGRCLTDYTCKGCGYTYQVDSSD